MRGTVRSGGVLALVALTLLSLAALLAITRWPARWRSGAEYRAAFRSVAGLPRGADVRYAGLVVGTVTELELDPSRPTRVLVRFKVRPETPVRTDTRATIAQVGFLGEPHLALTAGAEAAPRLAEGATLPTDEAVPIDEALRRLAHFLERADTLMIAAERLARGMDPEQVGRTIARVDTLVSRATAGSDRAFSRIDRTFAQLEGTFAGVDRSTERLGSILERTDRLVTVLDTTIRGASPGIAAIQRDALGTLRELRVLVSGLRDALDEGGGADEVVRNLLVVSENLARLTTRLERDPTSVLQARRALPKPAGPAPRD